MTSINSEVYAKSLIQRVSEALAVEKIVVKVGEWEPQRKMCHDNASYFCEHNPEYVPVRGWLYFNLPGMSYVKFLAHSVVRAPNGTFYDITPWEATEHYPFLACNLSEDEYADLVETQGCNQLHPNKN